MNSFVNFCIFDPYVCMYLRLELYEKEFTNTPDDQRIQKNFPHAQKVQEDVPDDQKPPETQEDYERPPGSRPSKKLNHIRHCLLDYAIALLYIEMR